MSWTYTLSDDTTITTGASFLAVDAGTSSSAYEFRAWWYKGLTTGSTQTRLYFRPRVAGAYSGHALLDQHAFEMRIVGSSNPDGHADFVPWTTGWTRVGANAVLECPPMATNCALHLEVRLSPLAQHSGTTASVAYDIVPVHDETPEWEAELLHSGILTGLGDGETTEWVESVAVTETGTPDDKANVAARWWLYLGVPYRAAAEAVTLSQDDGDSTTLSAGESYYALLSQPLGGGAVVATKGSLSAGTPDIPALPASSLAIASVLVAYGAGGSVIETADISTDDADGNPYTYDARFKPTAGTGLELLLGRGRTASADVEVETSVTLNASSTDYVWIVPGGGAVLTLTDVPPRAGAIPICEVTTDGSAVTAVADRRKFSEPNAELVRLAVAGTLTATTGRDFWVAPYRGAIDRVACYLRAASIGASGSTDIDVNKNATTIYGTKPSIAAQGTSDLDSHPTTTTFAAGDVLSFDLDAITSGGTTEIGCEVYLWIGKR